MADFDPATINRRAEYFDYDTIRSSPVLVAKIMKMSMPDVNVQGLASNLKQTFNYVNQQNMLAGVPGALNTLRLRAINMPDPAVRQAGLDLINNLQTLPQDQQSTALAYLLKNKVSNAPVNPTRALPTDAGNQTAEALSALNYGQDVSVGTVGTYEDNSGQLQRLFGLHIKGEDTNDVNRLAALKGLFPAGGNSASLVPMDDPGWSDTYKRLYADPFLNTVAYGLVPSFGHAVDYAEHGETDPVTGEHKNASFGEAAKRFALSAPALGFTATGAGAALAGVNAVAPEVSHLARDYNIPGATAAANIVGGGARGFNAVLAGAVGAVSDPILEATGNKKGTAEFDRGKDFLDNLLLLGVGHFVGEVGKAVKVSRSALPEAAAGELGIVENPLSAPTRSVLGSETLGKAAALPSALAHLPDYIIGKGVNNVFQVGIEKWASGKGGRNLLDAASEAVSSGEGVARLTKQYGASLPNDLARVLVETPAELRPQALIDYLKHDVHVDASVRNAAQLESVKSELTRLEAEGSPSPEISHSIDELKARQAYLESELRKPTPEPVLQYPKRSVVRAALLGAPTTKLERGLDLMFNHDLGGPLKKGLWDPYGLVDELSARPTLYNMSNKDAPIDGLHQNLDTLIKVFRRLKLPDDVAAEWIKKTDDLGAKLRSGDALPQEWYDHYTGMMDTVAAHLPKDIPAWLRREITQTAHQSVEGRTNSIMRIEGEDGVVRNEPVLSERLEDGSLRPLPSRPTEFLDDIHMPDFDLMIEASSVVRRSFARLKSKGFLGRYASDAMYYWPRKILAAMTGFQKPTILGLRAPAMALRQQLEQSLRSMMSGVKAFHFAPDGFSIFPGGVPLPHVNLGGLVGEGKIFTERRVMSSVFGEDGVQILGADPGLAGLDAPTHASIGSIGDQLAEGLDARKIPVSTSDFNTGRDIPKAEHYDGWLDAIQQASKDGIDMRLARGQTVDQLLAEADTNAYLKRELASQAQVLRRSTLAEEGLSDSDLLSRWADRRQEYLNQLTGGDPEIMRGVATGQFGGPRRTGPTDPISGRPHAEVYQARLDDLKSITENIDDLARTPGNYTALRALQKERLSILRQVEELETTAGFDPGAAQKVKVDTANRGARRAGREFLKQKWESGSVDMPGQVIVKKGVSRYSPENGDGPIGRGLDRFEDASRSYSKVMYKSMKPVTWLDMHGTRGSAWYDLSERYRATYERMGLSAEDAQAWGQIHAGTATRDLMYDLSARTSMQHALKDTFWFAPAAQEILWTWFVKIPSESYPILGHAALVAKGTAFVGLLRDAGIVQKDAEGEDVIVIPGVSKMVEKLTGLKVPEVAFGKLQGLNMVASGNPFSLSTLPAAGLGRLSQKYGGPFKQLSDIFMPMGTEVSATPQGITFAWESIFGTQFRGEFMSPGLAKRQYDSAFDDALQYALEDLHHQGVTVPKPEDFADTTSPDTGKPALSAAAEQKYDDALNAYTDRLRSTAKDYLRGTATVRLLGATVFPMSLYTTDSDKDALASFYDGLPKDADGKILPSVAGSIGDFLAEHPNSQAYAIGKSRFDSPDKSLPWTSTGDEAIFDEYLSGARRTMEPEEYMKYVQTVESHRVATEGYEAALRAISPKLDPVELLLNGYKKTQALADMHESLDLYAHLNPEAEGIWAQAKKDAAKYYGDPVRTFQAERLADTISNLQQLSPMFTGETGVTMQEFKTALTNLKIAYSSEGTFGEPQTKTEKAMATYFEKTLVPYAEETGALYDQANTLTAAGLDASKQYNQIAEINRKYAENPAKINGQEYPPPEAVFYGNKSPGDQKASVYHWLSQPVYWMDDFRFKTAGLADFDGRADFLTKWNALEGDFRSQMDSQGIVSSSTDYQLAEQAKNAQVSALAGQYGAGAQQLLTLNSAPPVFRLGTTGFGQGNANWAATTQMTASVWQKLVADGVSPSGYSQEAVYYKQWLFQRVEEMKTTDPEFERLWTKLSYSIPEKGATQKLGTPLYDAILFGAYSSQYMPTSVAAVGAPGLGLPTTALPAPPLTPTGG